MGSLAARLGRHLNGPSGGRLHWHIDYLASHGADKEFRVLPPGELSECGLNRLVAEIDGAVAPVSKFGSSDCVCRSHLHYLPGPVWPDAAGLVPWRSE